jgi:hypothetical protein
MGSFRKAVMAVLVAVHLVMLATPVELVLDSELSNMT